MKTKTISIFFMISLSFLLSARTPMVDNAVASSRHRHDSDLLLDYQEPMALCLGSISLPRPLLVESVDLSLYYKGNKLPLDMSPEKTVRKFHHNKEYINKVEIKAIPYSLVEAKAVQSFHMLICENVSVSSRSNTVQHLCVPKDVSYRYFILHGARQYDENNQVDGCLWSVQEQSLHGEQAVPDNTIVFVFDADLIEGLEVKSWAQNSNVRLMPDIVIKKTATESDLKQAIVQARLAAMDLDAIHNHNLNSVKKIDKKAVVTMMS